MALNQLSKGQLLALKALVDCIEGRRLAPRECDATIPLVDQAYEHAKSVWGEIVTKEDIIKMYSTPINSFI
jgi:hypothetical protein